MFVNASIQQYFFSYWVFFCLNSIDFLHILRIFCMNSEMTLSTESISLQQNNGCDHDGWGWSEKRKKDKCQEEGVSFFVHYFCSSSVYWLLFFFFKGPGVRKGTSVLCSKNSWALFIFLFFLSVTVGAYIAD